MEAFEEVMDPGRGYTIEYFSQLFREDIVGMERRPMSLESRVHGQLDTGAKFRMESSLLASLEDSKSEQSFL